MTPAGLRETLVVLALLSAGLAGCTDTAEPPADDGTNDAVDPRQGIAWDRLPAADEVPQADGARLMELVERQVYQNTTSEHPRYRTPGTEGHQAAIPVLEAMLEEAGAQVATESFHVELPRLGEVNATNVYGVRPGDPGEREIWLAAHWDSRAWADQANNESRREQPVLGANDGAAAVAVVTHALELLAPTDATIRVALFDVEDQGWRGEGWIQGSTHAAEARNETVLNRIEALILVDMPGHEHLSLPRESNSAQAAGNLTDVAFGVAERLGASSFQNTTGRPVLDDHIPFLERDVRAVDLIHLDENGTSAFPWTWHTPHDTPEHLSEASMAEVTRVTVGTAIAVDRGALPPRSS